MRKVCYNLKIYILISFFEVLNCWEYQNKYKVIDENGDQLYFLKEESSCCSRWCCGQARALSVSFQDNQGNEILRFERPLRCLGCCSDCCYPNLTQVIPTYLVLL